VAQAVNDAKETVKINNILNCDFVEGKVEMVNTSVQVTNELKYLIMFFVEGIKTSFG
jgi:hypothetical protein